MQKQSANQKVRQNSDNLSLIEYYASLSSIRKVRKGTETPRMKLLHSIAKVTGKAPSSIRRWVYGTATPSHAEKALIAKLLKSSIDILFPVE